MDLSDKHVNDDDDQASAETATVTRQKLLNTSIVALFLSWQHSPILGSVKYTASWHCKQQQRYVQQALSCPPQMPGIRAMRVLLCQTRYVQQHDKDACRHQHSLLSMSVNTDTFTVSVECSRLFNKHCNLRAELTS